MTSPEPQPPTVTGLPQSVRIKWDGRDPESPPLRYAIQLVDVATGLPVGDAVPVPPPLDAMGSPEIAAHFEDVRYAEIIRRHRWRFWANRCRCGWSGSFPGGSRRMAWHGHPRHVVEELRQAEALPGLAPRRRR